MTERCDGVAFEGIPGVFVWFDLVEYFLFYGSLKFLYVCRHDRWSRDSVRVAVSHAAVRVRVTRSTGVLFLGLPCFRVGVSCFGRTPVSCAYRREMRDLCCYASVYL